MFGGVRGFVFRPVPRARRVSASCPTKWFFVYLTNNLLTEIGFYPHRQCHFSNPMPPLRTNRQRGTRPPNNYAREQEEEATRYALGSQTERRGPSTRNETAAERVDISEDETGTGNSNPQMTELLAELVKLQIEIKRRDEIHRDELREVSLQELAELRNELATSQTNHDETLREIQSLRTSITTPDPTNNLSYADVARTPPTSQPSNIRTLSSFNTTPTTFTDTLYCTIDTSKVADNGNDWTSAGPTRAAVEKEIRTRESHANWRCRAVTVDPKNTNRIRIACRVKPSTSWLRKLWKQQLAQEPGCSETTFTQSKSIVSRKQQC